MSKRSSLRLVVALTLISSQPLAPAVASPSTNSSDIVPDRVLVKFRPGTPRAERIRLLGPYSDHLHHFEDHQPRSGSPDVMRRNKPRQKLEIFDDIVAIHLRSGMSQQELLNTLRSDPSVEIAEPDVQIHPSITPNDPYYSIQSHLPQIHAPEAWDLTTGKPSVIVAVLDSGIDFTHTDLKSNIWTNVKEISGNGIDDDGDGYVDDVHGWDFVNNDNDPTDDYTGVYHGTLCSGIIGAVGNNNFAVAGVAWNVQIMPLKVIGNTGLAGSALAAIQYANDHGASIINMSWGSSSSSTILQQALAEYRAAGGLPIASAGNDNSSVMNYPAAYPGVISVGAVDSTDHRATFSNFGSWVKVSAPGVHITSTFSPNIVATGDGTSFAAPQVAAEAALIWSVRPDLYVDNVEALIEDGDDIGAQQIGKRINVFKALNAATGVPVGPTITVNSPANNATVTGPVSISFSASDASGITRADVLLDGKSLFSNSSGISPFVFSWDSSSVPNGAHVLTLKATSGVGGVTGKVVNVVTSNIDTTLPTVSFANVVANEVDSGPKQIFIDANDNWSIGHVDVYVDSKLLGTANFASSVGHYVRAWNTKLETNGPHTLEARAYDSSGNMATTGSVPVTVLNNSAPIPTNQSVTTAEDVSLPIVLLATDPDSNSMTFRVTSILHGTYSGTPPNITYIPTADYNGPDTLTFVANDGYVDSAPGTISITVTPVNDAPVASSQSVTTLKNTAVPIALSVRDVDSTSFTYAIVQPGHGAVTGTPPNVTYTPTVDYVGPDSFTFKANDGALDSNVATISITVNAPSNTAPVAKDQSVTLAEDTVQVITLLGTDADSNPLTYALGPQPAHGKVTLVGQKATYTPSANYNGADNFTFKVNDGLVDSAFATVSITVTPVNDAPKASNQSASTPMNTLKSFLLLVSDVDGDPITINTVTPPAHGTYQTSGTRFTYTPNTNYFGPDSFVYTATDGTLSSAVTTVSITVLAPTNTPPVAKNQTVTTAEDVALPIILSATDTDPLTFRVTSVLHGTYSGTPPNITYIPTADYNGPDTLTFVANDGFVDSAPGTISITVTPVNDAPVASSQSVTTLKNTAVPIALSVRDVDSTSFTYAIVQPGHGAVTGTPPNVTYTPTVDYVGADSFTFKANDGSLDSNVATVSITVNAPSNTAPVAKDQSVTLAEDTVQVITLLGTDADSNSLTYALGPQPAHGKVTLVGQQATYTPLHNYNGPDSFTFKVNDGTVDSAFATVSITVTPVNDAPQASNQSTTTPMNTVKSFLLLASDPDGDPLTIVPVTPTAHGTFQTSGTRFTYTPAPNYVGTDSFSYKATDGILFSNVVTLSITVSGFATTMAIGAPVVQKDLNLINSLNPTAKLFYTMPHADHVRMAVYDLQGTKVATLVDGDRDAGDRAELWDGRDEHGTPVRSGVYFVTSNYFSHPRKVVIVR